MCVCVCVCVCVCMYVCVMSEARRSKTGGELETILTSFLCIQLEPNLSAPAFFRSLKNEASLANILLHGLWSRWQEDIQIGHLQKSRMEKKIKSSIFPFSPCFSIHEV